MARRQRTKAGRMKHLQEVADKVLDCIESTVDTWDDGAPDKQNIRQITGALKDLQDIQSCPLPGEDDGKELRVVIEKDTLPYTE